MTCTNAMPLERHDMPKVLGFGGKATPGFGVGAAAILTLTVGLLSGHLDPSPLPQRLTTPLPASSCTVNLEQAEPASPAIPF